MTTFLSGWAAEVSAAIDSKARANVIPTAPTNKAVRISFFIAQFFLIALLLYYYRPLFI
jgi:hypothetical protein